MFAHRQSGTDYYLPGGYIAVEFRFTHLSTCNSTNFTVLQRRIPRNENFLGKPLHENTSQLCCVYLHEPDFLPHQSPF